MIRRANFVDMPAITALMTAGHARSIYADISDIDLPSLRSIFMQAMQRHGPIARLGSTCVFVSERSGIVEGLILGTIGRLYHAGVKLEATDMFFYADGGDPRAASKLANAFLEWAATCPDVALIRMGVTNIIGSPDRAGKLLRRKGFVQSGAIYERKAR
jgi:hypothetical protein